MQQILKALFICEQQSVSMADFCLWWVISQHKNSSNKYSLSLFNERLIIREYTAQRFCDEGPNVHASPLMFLPPFTLQTAQPDKLLVPFPSAFWRTAASVWCTCVWTCECMEVCDRMFLCSSPLSHPGSLAFLFLSCCHCFQPNAPAARLDMRWPFSEKLSA